MSPYPRDEFDDVPENSARRGVHRGGPPPARHTFWLLIALGAAALLIGLMAFFVFPRLGLGDRATPAPASAGTTAPASAGASGTSTPSTPAPGPATSAPAPGLPTPAPAVPAPTGPVGASTPSSAPSSAPAAAAVDRGTPVAIFNAAGTEGLAGKYSDMVSADGWTVGQAANWDGPPQAASVIYYEGPAQQAGAEELGRLTGIATLVQTTELQVPLAVVLGPGAE